MSLGAAGVLVSERKGVGWRGEEERLGGTRELLNHALSVTGCTLIS